MPFISLTLGPQPMIHSLRSLRLVLRSSSPRVSPPSHTLPRRPHPFGPPHVLSSVSFPSLSHAVHIISFPISSRRDRSERRKERVTGTEGNEMGERYYMRVPSVPCHSVPSSLRSSVTSFPVHTSLYLHSPTVRSGTSNE